MILTRHAIERKSQRSIPDFVIAATYQFGAARSVRGRVQSYTLDRESIELVEDACPGSLAKALHRYIGVYIIVGDEEKIVTVARGSSRFPRH